MGSWRGFVIPGRSQPNSLKMKVLLVLAVAAAVSAHSGEDYKMFMKWAKGKAMESCWGEDNMKLLTLNMKKAVSKCMQEDAPELDLPPFRYMNRFTNCLVSMANSRSQDQDLYKMMKFMMMMKMMQQVGSDNQDHHNFRDSTGAKYRNNFDHQMMDRMDNGNMMENMMKMMSRMMNKEGQYERSEYDNMDMYDMFSKMYNSNKYDKYNRHDNHDSNYRSYDDMSPMMRRFMSKRQADDSLQLNDRLKEKLEHVMEEHVSEMSNMTCVLREMNVLNSRNNIDIAAMKADTENYNVSVQLLYVVVNVVLFRCPASGSSRSTSPSWTTATRSPRTSPQSSTTCSTSTETTSSATWARSRASSPAAREPR